MQVEEIHDNGIDILTVKKVTDGRQVDVNPLVTSIDTILGSRKHAKMVVDMRDVAFESAETMSTMLTYHQKLEGVKAAGGGIKIVVSEDQLRNMQTMGVDKLFDHYLSVEAAKNTYG